MGVSVGITGPAGCSGAGGGWSPVRGWIVSSSVVGPASGASIARAVSRAACPFRPGPGAFRADGSVGVKFASGPAGTGSVAPTGTTGTGGATGNGLVSTSSGGGEYRPGSVLFGRFRTGPANGSSSVCRVCQRAVSGVGTIGVTGAARGGSATTDRTGTGGLSAGSAWRLSR